MKSSNFPGYPRTALRFLTDAPSRDRSWFDRERATYEDAVLEPTRALVTALGEALRSSVSTGITAESKINGSISPLFRDRRFSKDPALFKDYLLLNFWEGTPKKFAPTLRVRITPSQIGFATGAIFAEGPRLEQWRSAVDDPIKGDHLAKAIAHLRSSLPIDLPPPELKRVPPPFPEAHPRGDLLRHKSFQLRWEEHTPTEIHTPTFVRWCAERLARCASIHQWLVQHLSHP